MFVLLQIDNNTSIRENNILTSLITIVFGSLAREMNYHFLTSIALNHQSTDFSGGALP